MPKAKTHWWHDKPAERYWCEITGREDIGSDLNCPQADESGRPYWSYSLIKEIRPGEIIFHYSTTEQAFVGASMAAESAREGTIQWTPHGTVGRRRIASIKSRPAWRLHVRPFIWSAAPLTLVNIQKDDEWIRKWIAARHDEKPLYAPIQPYPKRLRAYQGYLTKMPADFVERWSPLSKLARTLDERNELANRHGLEAEDAMAILAEEAEPGRSGQGFLVSAKLRKKVEDHAVQKAKKHFESCGYKVDVFGKPYDLRCSLAEEILYVEVKGTTTDGLIVLLTPNEIAFARSHKGKMALYVVHNIEIEGDEAQPAVRGGEVRMIQPWDIDAGVLQPLGFSYSLPSRA